MSMILPSDAVVDEATTTLVEWVKDRGGNGAYRAKTRDGISLSLTPNMVGPSRRTRRPTAWGWSIRHGVFRATAEISGYVTDADPARAIDVIRAVLPSVRAAGDLMILAERTAKSMPGSSQ